MVSTIFGTTKAQSILRSKRLIAERGKVLPEQTPDLTFRTATDIKSKLRAATLRFDRWICALWTETRMRGYRDGR